MWRNDWTKLRIASPTEQSLSRFSSFTFLSLITGCQVRVPGLLEIAKLVEEEKPNRGEGDGIRSQVEPQKGRAAHVRGRRTSRNRPR